MADNYGEPGSIEEFNKLYGDFGGDKDIRDHFLNEFFKNRKIRKDYEPIRALEKAVESLDTISEKDLLINIQKQLTLITKILFDIKHKDD